MIIDHSKHPMKFCKIPVRIIKRRYISADGPIALIAENASTGEPQYTATVNLDTAPSEGCVWLKDWGGNEGLPDALVSAGLIELTGNECPTGFCSAKEARLVVEIPE